MRYHYERPETDRADTLIDRRRLPELPGTQINGHQIAAADDFSYIDPIDGSTSAYQGIRIVFTDDARIVYRLSGTGTEGATLRVYLERFKPEPAGTRSPRVRRCRAWRRSVLSSRTYWALPGGNSRA